MRRQHELRTLLSTSLLAIAICSCGVQQQAAEKLIDPRLRERGVLVERQSSARELELGQYRVDDLAIEEQPFDGSGPLAADAKGRTRPTQQWRLHFLLNGGEHPWVVQCIG